MMKVESRIANKTFTVGIIGLGYVGLPLLNTFHKAGFPVIGFDTDEEKIKSIHKGKSYIKHFSDEDIEKLSDSDQCKVTKDFKLLEEVDAVLICVPTPLDHHREPDMTYVEETAKTISLYLKKGQLVVLESTTWPGTSDELLTQILEDGSGLKAGSDFYIAYSPEREDPGNSEFDTKSIPKLVGASVYEAREIAVALYSSSIDTVIPVSSSKVAESAKLLENIFRSVNIALVNEMKQVMDAMGIDIHEVVDAAATKPFGFMKFTPGPGLGGHCIPIDPYYLTWKAKEFGLNTRFIELAGEVNNAMPQFVIDKLILALNGYSKSVKGSKILVLGVAYKKDVDDMRESPSFVIMDKLVKLGAIIDYYDPWIPEIPATREHMNWKGVKSIEWEKENIESYDSILIITDHTEINYNELLIWSNCIVDSRNVYSYLRDEEKKKVFKA
ncbi:MAG: nucleotide sugar dehydrogenase [Balneolaceae bacterium]|nr:nucleotide sugar dehydrogenase [Balneolaceae bacterium]MBO6546927.1 nucleotide sugar dehydrogenase [Balneolaceae bacterium]MBO6649287.1 nucleotide sugar dehydrogenase [Balneolaceae bacterium]